MLVQTVADQLADERTLHLPNIRKSNRPGLMGYRYIMLGTVQYSISLCFVFQSRLVCA